MGFNQVSTLLASIVGQATGKDQITPTSTEEFVSVAKVGLETGYDALSTAISQVLSKTVFSIRPYNRKFKGMYADSVRYGNHIRKLQVIDKPFEEDDRIKLVDGQSIDQYKVNKPKVLQTNFYGENVFMKSLTIYRDQLDVAFSGPEEFGRFISMIMTNATDMIEQAHESMARAAIVNFIAGKKMCDSTNVIYLLDKYEDETGLTGLTSETIKQPENFAPFVRWLFGYLKTTSDLLTERSYFYHKNFQIDGNDQLIARHTPLKNQKCYIYSKELNNMDSSVLSSTFHDEYLKIMDHERVNFWQSIDTPMGLMAVPGYNADDGSIAESETQVVMSNVFGLIADEEALGYTTINEWTSSTPFNSRGGYYNIFWHFTDRYWNDFTENAVVLVLDHSENALETVQVVSEEGTNAGDTTITIDPTPTESQKLYYKVDDTATTVTYGMDVSLWDTWDGSADITAATGKKITIVIANSSDKAVGAGVATVTAKS